MENEKYAKSINLYNDHQGVVEYVEHMGSDLTIVNSARYLCMCVVSIIDIELGLLMRSLGAILK